MRRIGVVRLFVSGESWYERTRQIVGLEPGAPAEPPAEGTAGDMFARTFWRIDSTSTFALSREGLSQAPEMGHVLEARARALSEDPERESVLLLAHGPGDDEENERWIAAISERADAIREGLPFREVAVMTLREDWDDKREEAEERIRRFVEEAGREGGRCLVIPFRVHGFGPYGEVLDDLAYVSNGRGLLPHTAVGDWMLRQAKELDRRSAALTAAPRTAAR